MKVVLAEKPSVARDIAKVLGASSRHDGWLEGNGYLVTYAFGHLVSLAEPEEMDPRWGKPWRLEQLPMIPSAWKYTVVEKSKKQFEIIKRLFLDKRVESIVCATDAGREGEHIFRLIYQMSGSNKPVERLWISSLTPEAIADGFAKLKPAREYDNLAEAAAARAHADWIVGLNFTRAYTIASRELYTIGRVQTPTLALLVARQAEIEKFQSNKFFEIDVDFAPGFRSRYINQAEPPQTRLDDKAAAEIILSEIKAAKDGVVSSVVTKEKRSKPPALFDLLTLQKEANKRFGYTAQDTLAIAQSLYEQYKLISYPRTESRHLSEDMLPELPKILSRVLSSDITADSIRAVFAEQGIAPGKITTSLIRPLLDKSYIDNAKLTDHHAIIPTPTTPPAALPEKQLNIYKLVANRFMCIFLPPEIRDETTAIILVASSGQTENQAHRLRARGVVVRQAGWTLVEPRRKESTKKDNAKSSKKKSAAKSEEDEDSQILPPLASGQTLEKLDQKLKEGKTTPPKPYDDGTLLAAMKSAGQDLDDEDLASYMKQKGLGTPATRAAIIERLLSTGYVVREKKWLVPTEKGKALINRINDSLKDVALTASWEQKLSDMQEGTLESGVFYSEIGNFVETLLPSVKPVASGSGFTAQTIGKVSSSKSSTNQLAGKTGQTGNDFGLCPACKQGRVASTPKGAGCMRWRDGCKFTVWREQYGKKLTDAQIKDLVGKGATKLIKGFKKKDGSGKYDARLVVGDNGKISLDFSENEQAESSVFGVCPKCKGGVLRATAKGVGCNRWREGCLFTIWRITYGRELADEEIRSLLSAGNTPVLEGFKKKDGTGTYKARLVLNEEKQVRLSFEINSNSENFSNSENLSNIDNTASDKKVPSAEQSETQKEQNLPAKG